MVKTRITDKGIVQEPGSGFEGPTPSASQTKTATFSLVHGDSGVIVMSASQGVLTGTMPDSSDASGKMFVFRSTSPSVHVLTASSGDGNVFSYRAGINNAGTIETGSHGSKLAFPAIAGSSVAMISDGNKWLIIGGSGSIVLTAEAV